MPSPAGDDERAQGGPDLVTFGQMVKRLEAAGLPTLTHQRCRQLAEEDPDWPIPMDQAVKVGRMSLFDWNVLEPYFRNRTKRQGQRPSKPEETPPNDADSQLDRGAE
jgi:hypothetical protein